MEPSEVKRRVRDLLAEARRTAAERRSRRDEAARAWSEALETVVLPVVRQLVQVLKAEGQVLQMFTPADQVRLAVEGHPDDFVELRLDAADGEPAVVCRINRTRGRETVTEDLVFLRGAEIPGVSEEQVLDYLMRGVAGLLVR